MKRILTSVLFVGALFRFVAFVGVLAAQTPSKVDPTITKGENPRLPFQPDHDLVQAIARKDKGTVGRLLDADFTWTDSEGRTLTRSQVLEKLPAPALGDESQVSVQERVKSQIVIHRAERGNIYVLRV
jgi:hypothetical protein